MTTLAESSPSPRGRLRSDRSTALPGDPTKGGRSRAELRHVPWREPRRRDRCGPEPDREAPGVTDPGGPRLLDRDHHQRPHSRSPATRGRSDAGEGRQRQPHRPGRQGPRRLHHPGEPHRPGSGRSPPASSPSAPSCGSPSGSSAWCSSPIALHLQHAMDRAPRRGATQVAEGSSLYPIPVGGSPRVLILFSDTGGGHRAAARALTDALRLLDPTCVVTVADPLSARARSSSAGSPPSTRP